MEIHVTFTIRVILPHSHYSGILETHVSSLLFNCQLDMNLAKGTTCPMCSVDHEGLLTMIVLVRLSMVFYDEVLYVALNQFFN